MTTPMNMSVNIHHPMPITCKVLDLEVTTIRIGGALDGVTLFFTTPNEARQWLTDGITAVTHAMYTHDNPPEPAPDAHLEPDYDDRNGD